MLNPEITNFIDRAGKGQAVHYLAVGEEGGVEIKADSFFLRKINPFFEMLRLDFVSVRKFTVFKNSIACMQVQFMLSGHEAEYLINICHQFFRCPCLSGIVSGSLDSSGKRSLLIKAGNIVALPAVHGNRNVFQGFHRLVGVHANCRINFLCGFISFFYVHNYLLSVPWDDVRFTRFRLMM